MVDLAHVTVPRPVPISSKMWGSVAKPIPATAVMTLVEFGVVALDEPVRTHLPSFTLSTLTTRTGSPSDICWSRPAASRSIPASPTASTSVPLRTRTPSRTSLPLPPTPLSGKGSSTAVPTTSCWVRWSRRSAGPFVEYLHQQVFDPLQMGQVIAGSSTATTELAPGHGYAFGRPTTMPLRYDATGPSYGYLGGTITDLAHFAIAHLSGGRDGSPHRS